MYTYGTCLLVSKAFLQVSKSLRTGSRQLTSILEHQLNTATSPDLPKLWSCFNIASRSWARPYSRVPGGTLPCSLLCSDCRAFMLDPITRHPLSVERSRAFWTTCIRASESLVSAFEGGCSSGPTHSTQHTHLEAITQAWHAPAPQRPPLGLVRLCRRPFPRCAVLHLNTRSH